MEDKEETPEEIYDYYNPDLASDGYYLVNIPRSDQQQQAAQMKLLHSDYTRLTYILKPTWTSGKQMAWEQNQVPSSQEVEKMSKNSKLSRKEWSTTQNVN